MRKSLGAPVYYGPTIRGNVDSTKTPMVCCVSIGPNRLTLKGYPTERCRVVNKLNNRPRKTLGKTPAQLMHNHLAAQAA